MTKCYALVGDFWHYKWIGFDSSAIHKVEQILQETGKKMFICYKIQKGAQTYKRVSTCDSFIALFKKDGRYSPYPADAVQFVKDYPYHSPAPWLLNSEVPTIILLDD